MELALANPYNMGLKFLKLRIINNYTPLQLSKQL
jgi:hypothetical protein